MLWVNELLALAYTHSFTLGTIGSNNPAACNGVSSGCHAQIQHKQYKA